MNLQMHHSDFIVDLVKIYNPKVYLELGLYDGETFFKVTPLVTKAIGVDIKQHPNLKTKNYSNMAICICTTDYYFEQYSATYDMIFIDADHCYNSVKTDFHNSIRHLNKGGIIILHDTDPSEVKYLDKG